MTFCFINKASTLARVEFITVTSGQGKGWNAEAYPVITTKISLWTLCFNDMQFPVKSFKELIPKWPHHINCHQLSFWIIFYWRSEEKLLTETAHAVNVNTRWMLEWRVLSPHSSLHWSQPRIYDKFHQTHKETVRNKKWWKIVDFHTF